MKSKSYEISIEFFGKEQKYTRLIINDMKFQLGNSKISDFIRISTECLKNNNFCSCSDISIECLNEKEIDLLKRNKINIESCFFCKKQEPIYLIKFVNDNIYLCENHLKELIIYLRDLQTNGLFAIKNNLKFKTNV